MNRFPIPHHLIKSIYDIGPNDFLKMDVQLLLLDLDNTISPYSTGEPLPELIRWAQDLKTAGIDLFIISNSHSNRPEIFAEALGIGYVGHARKPFTKVARRVLAELNADPDKTAIIGDQIYTDVLCARLLGLKAIAVRPINMKNPLLAFRYLMEIPFRLACRMRNKNG